MTPSAPSASAEPATASVAAADALVGSQFQLGFIISDEQFFSASAMTQAEIQAFLQSQIGTC
jgi:hypothetical protein